MGIFFVLNGFINGEDGDLAITTSDEKMLDGWYVFIDEDDVNGIGPFTSRQEAERVQLWLRGCTDSLRITQ